MQPQPLATDQDPVKPSKTDVMDILHHVTWGTLSLVEEVKKNICDIEYHPYSVPITFVYFNGKLYMHGIDDSGEKKKSKKLECLRSNPNVQFLIVDEFAFIPSYYANFPIACFASQCFKSVLIKGEATFSTSKDSKIPSKTKIGALAALAEKLQPEEDKESFSMKQSIKDDGPHPIPAVIELTPSEVTARFKFCQGYADLKDPEYKNRQERILVNLEKKGTKLDLATAAMIKKGYTSDATRIIL